MALRIIARLDVKSEFLIKGLRFEGLRKIGDPAIAALKYFEDGVDELVLVDNVASVYGRNHMGSLLQRVSEATFVPLTAGGGIRSLNDAKTLFSFGADKVAVNTASFSNPNLIKDIAEQYGSQSVVGSIQARRDGPNWECQVEQAREGTGIDLKERIQQLTEQGVGELLITSVDNDGVQNGFDFDLAKTAVEASSVPVIIGGGCGGIDDVIDLTRIPTLSGVAIGSAFHFNRFTASELKQSLVKTMATSDG
jgi:imidazoleglycerol phosphate synthase cyclase subunit